MTKVDELLIQLEEANKLISDQQYALDRAAIVAITDKGGTISYVNDKFCQLSQYSKEELIGQSHSLINSRRHSQQFFVDMWKNIASGQVWQGEICNRAKDGSLYWVDTTIVPFLDKEGKPYQYIAIRNDITHRKMADEVLEKDRKRLFVSEKMASLGILSSGISHELGNPLGALRGRLEMLERWCEKGELDREKIHDSMKKMISLVDRMSKIIRGLKAYARDGSRDPFATIDIGCLIGDIIEISRERCHKNGITLKSHGLEDRVLISGREAEVGQVMVNLLNNAVDAAKNTKEKWIEFRVTSEDSLLKVRVVDSGCGIPAGIANKIFDPFYTTKTVSEGTGLGLSICKSIVEDHQGQIQICKNLKNTCFEVTLPLFLPRA